MIIVSDTSPLSALLRIEQVHLLPALYGKVIVPVAVQRELLGLRDWGYDPQEILSQPWLEVHTCPHNAHYEHLRIELDEGESEAIVLATMLRADLLLIDERKGRTVAMQEGLNLTGILGVLFEAKQAGLIPAVKPLVTDLVGKANFRIDDHLFRKVLALASEL